MRRRPGIRVSTPRGSLPALTCCRAHWLNCRDSHCVLHQFSFCFFTWKLLRVVWHCGCRSGRMQPSRRRRVDRRNHHRYGATSSSPKSGQLAGYSQFAELRRHGRSHSHRSRRGPNPETTVRTELALLASEEVHKTVKSSFLAQRRKDAEVIPQGH